MRRDLALGIAATVLVLAATVSLDRVFLTNGWLPFAWSAAGLALAIAVAGRRIGFGVAATLVASAAGFAVFTYVVHLGAGGLIPGSEQLTEYRDLWSQGVTDLIQEPAPARTTPGLMVVLTTGTWWIAHLVHELLVRARRPGPTLVAAGLLWAFPLAVPQPPGRTWPQALPFLAAAGLVLLVEPDPDLSAWRRPTGRSLVPSSAALTVGGLAIVAAALFPGVLPGYGAEPWIDIGGADAARGYQPIVDVSRRLKLPEARDLLRVSADRPMYLRLAGLDTFDGASWRLGPPDKSSFSPDEVIPADRNLPPEVAIAEREIMQVEIENLSLENVFVPVPYHPLRIEGSAARRMVYSQEGTFIASSDTLEGEPALVPGLSYGVEAAIPAPSAEDLSAIPAASWQDPAYGRWTALPRDYADLEQVANEVIAAAGAATPYEATFALQDFFRDTARFRYSTDVAPLRSAADLTRFVVDDRTGYCEYYATAMAVMLRSVGIPSRVAVGFRLGDEVEPGQYVVTTDDAHAWVEVLFPGYGWIQFEPTPALPDALVPARNDITPAAPVGVAPRLPPGEIPDLPGDDDLANDPGQPGEIPDAGGAPGVDAGGGLADGARTPLVVGLLAIVAAIVGAGALLYRSRSHHHPDLDDVDRVLAAQRRVYHTARGVGLPRRDSETAVDVAARWAAEGRVELDDATRLARLSQAAAFGSRVPPGSGAAAEELGDRVVEALRGSVTSRARMTAPLRAPVEDAVAVGRRAAAAVLERTRSAP